MENSNFPAIQKDNMLINLDKYVFYRVLFESPLSNFSIFSPDETSHQVDEHSDVEGLEAVNVDSHATPDPVEPKYDPAFQGTFVST